MKSWLKKNGTEMHSTHNEGKSLDGERFTRALKNKFYKYTTLISKNVYIVKLEDIVYKNNNTYYSATKMNPVDVKSSTSIDSSKEVNNKDSKFKIGDIITISKYINIFAKCYVPNWSQKVFVIKKVKNTVPWTYIIIDFKAKKLFEHFTKKNCKKQIKKSLVLKK